jgi:hypothetical protein
MTTNTLEKQQSVPVPTTDKGKLIIRMSESGHCVRALTAQKSGKYSNIAKAPPVWLQTSADEGKMHEIWIRNELKEKGYEVWGDQEELKIEFPEFILLGHIDGKCTPPLLPLKILLEIKSMSEYEYQRWHRGKFAEFPQYASQLSCYMTASDLTNVLYIVKNRSSGYKDWNDLDLNNFPMDAEFNKVIDKCHHIIDCLEHNKLPEREYDGASLECRRCAYDKLCISDIDELNLSTLINNKELIETTNRYREALLKMDEWKSKRDEEKQVLKKQLQSAGLKKMTCNQLAIQLITVRPRVDYPKSKLVTFFTLDQLAPAASIKDGYEFLRIDDKMSEKLEYGQDKDEAE